MPVFVLDKKGINLMPCSERIARLILLKSRARIHKLKLFTNRIVDRYLKDSKIQNIDLNTNKSTTLINLKTGMDYNVY
jgi:hypothetical protein